MNGYGQLFFFVYVKMLTFITHVRNISFAIRLKNYTARAILNVIFEFWMMIPARFKASLDTFIF